MLPQCPPLATLVINTLTVNWRHIKRRRATCVFFCSGHNSSFLVYSCINSLQALHQGWLHFHINYCCYGNHPKEVITQVVMATMANWHWAECSSSDDFKVEAEKHVFFSNLSSISQNKASNPLLATCYCLSSQVSFMYCSTAGGQQVNSEIYCCCIHTHTHTPDNVIVNTGILCYLL